MARRRYRLFTICAALVLFLLYRVSQNAWEDSSRYASLKNPPSSNSPAAAPAVAPESPPRPASKLDAESEEPESSKPKPKPKPKPETKPEHKPESKQPESKQPESKQPESKPAPETVVSKPKQGKLDDDEEPGVKLPKLKDIDYSKPPINGKASASSVNSADDDDDEEINGIHQKDPPKTAPGLTVDGHTHWHPVKEHFPLPAESIVSLPTGKPLKVPRVQHEFGGESPEAKSRRVNRQERVQKEIARAWSGYRKFAWMHDELSPVSAKYRDPFCGWAATLVDSLDTLWIAGLKDEFDEAAKAVKQIDFTTTPRSNIPVFETTIRYLGGLLGAFDVSGGHDGGYPWLLTKAVELAEILMGIFDTPNRMPVLYYQWQPEYASQPHRAGSVGIAELGTLSMEFTRLAQLTSEMKYYDAVDRITDALVDLQTRGTSIPGLFPENLDASGCNHTATALRDQLSRAAQKQMDEDISTAPVGYVPGQNLESGPAVGQKGTQVTQAAAEENEFIVGKFGADDALAKLQAADEARAKAMDKSTEKPAAAGKPNGFVVGKIGSEDPRDEQAPAGLTDAESKGFVVGKMASEEPPAKHMPAAEAPGKFVVGKIGSEDPKDAPGAKTSENNPDYAKQGPREDDNTETRPSDSLRRRDVPPSERPLDKSSQVPPVKEKRRGMPPFAADGSTSNWECVPQGIVVGGYGFEQYHMGGGQDSAYEYFPKEYLLLGGLEAKYKKLYEDTIEATNEWLLYRPMVDGDWNILFPAKVSTNGNPSNDLIATFEVTHLTCFIGGMYGLGGKIFGREKDLEIAKQLTDGCVWAYQSTISGIMPEGFQVSPCPTLEKCEFNQTLWYEALDPSKEWRDQQMAEWKQQVAEIEKKQGKKTQQKSDGDPRRTGDKEKETAGDALEQSAKDFATTTQPLRKRAAIPVPKDGKAPAYEDFDVGSELPQSLKDKIGLKDDADKKPVKAEVGIQRDPSAPIDSVLEANRLPPMEFDDQQVVLPERPQSHEEFVKSRITDWGFAPGVTQITSRHYILRPEAIESVWYMYRITGDPTWMEKGWTMFEATIHATRTEIANSAIDDVNSNEPGLKDEMESFWLAETLKYYYLLFSEPSVISLDEWVLNTEAHPFKRPGGGVIGHSI
ncbi:glycoside hydrolase family 47 protein [Trichoderma austrokoningii]